MFTGFFVFVATPATDCNKSIYYDQNAETLPKHGAVAETSNMHARLIFSLFAKLRRSLAGCFGNVSAFSKPDKAYHR